MIVTALKYLACFAVAFAAFVFLMDRHFRAVDHSGPVTDHFDGKRFSNIGGAGMGSGEQSGLDVIKWMLSREENVWTERKVVQTKPVERVPGSEIVATHINHATVLIQTEGLNVITDPVYSRRASPVQFAGPVRHANPGVAFDDLPPIDVVLVSHNHYDHMDIGTLRLIREKFNPLILVPLGNAAYLERRGVAGAVELDWWQSHELANGTKVSLVPAQHFSARSISDRNRTLWGGYVIGAKAGDIYFAGDTGYGPFVEKIRERYPDGFRLGLLPVGAYVPEWFMSPVHVSPDEALRMKKELGIESALAIHYGTFKLADDQQYDPETKVNAFNDDSFVAIQNGKSLRVQ